MQDTAITLPAYAGLIHQFCRRFHNRVMRAGFNIDYADIYQDGVETFLKCRETFNPATGNKFSTYLTLSLRNNLNNSVKDEVPVASLDAMAEAAGEDGMDLDALSIMGDDCAHTPDWHLEVKEALDYTQQTLSAWAQFALQQIMAPSTFLKTELTRHQANVAAARAAGKDARNKELSVEFVVRVFGPLKGYATEAQQKKLAKDIRAEFNEVSHALTRA